jgi:hypothetical protein
MKKVMVAFEFDDGLTPDQVRQNKAAYVAFQEIKCHEDGSNSEGKVCSWRTYDGGTGKHNLFKCCAP